LNFNENEIFGAALIGFDMIDGPFLKWKKAYQDTQTIIDLNDFAMNFYLAFRGGNSGKKPRAILYDEFYIVAFPNDLELCCLFMKPQDVDNNIRQLNKIASRIIHEMEPDNVDEEELSDSTEDDIDEIARLIINLLNNTEMSTPELRRYFKLSNAQIWKLMSELETNKLIKRTDKKGRAVYWTAN
jgi:biotin operon repressor